MKGRDFGTLLGGSTIWSFSARAQQSPTPKALGLSVLSVLLARADEVIE
jgi:hypothetical protein